MFEQIFPYPDNMMPHLIYRKSMRETLANPKVKLERKQNLSYRSMEILFHQKSILQLTFGRSFTRLRPFSTCINSKNPTVYALQSHILFSTSFVFSSQFTIRITFFYTFPLIKFLLAFYYRYF